MDENNATELNSVKTLLDAKRTEITELIAQIKAKKELRKQLKEKRLEAKELRNRIKEIKNFINCKIETSTNTGF